MIDTSIYLEEFGMGRLKAASGGRPQVATPASGPRKMITKGTYRLQVLNTEEVKEFIKKGSNAGFTTYYQSYFIFGDPGMGKSAMMRSTAREIMQIYNKRDKTERVFIEGVEIAGNPPLFNKIKNNPEGYYVFLDIRAGQMQNVDFQPYAFAPKAEDETNVVAPGLNYWMALLNLEGLAGMLFFDELNQADQVTQAATYGIFNKGERGLNTASRIRSKELWGVHAAGNLPQDDLGGTYELLQALRDRMNMCWLEIDYPTWKEWAISDKAVNDKGERIISPMIIAFLDGMNNSSFGKDTFDIFFKGKPLRDEAKYGPAANPRKFEEITKFLDEQLSKYESKILEINDRIEELNAIIENPPSEAQRRRANVEKIELEKDLKARQSTLVADVTKDLALTINEQWADNFASFLRSGLDTVLVDLFNGTYDPDTQDFQDAIMDRFYVRKTTTAGGQQASTRGMSNMTAVIENVTNSKAYIESALGEICRAVGVVNKEGRLVDPKEINYDILKKDKVLKKKLYDLMKALMTAAEIIDKQNSDITILLLSYLNGYTIDRAPVWEHLKLVLDNVYTDKEFKEMTSVKNIEVDLYASPDAVEGAYNNISAITAKEQSEEEPVDEEEEAEDVSVTSNVDELQSAFDASTIAVEKLSSILKQAERL